MAVYIKYIITDGKNFIRLNNGRASLTDIKLKSKQFKSKAQAERFIRAKGNFNVGANHMLEYAYVERWEIHKEKKRRSFNQEERKIIYAKTNGHCYLCGEFVDFSEFEVEHKIPLARGGTNDFSNLFPVCHICNTLKGSIAPTDLINKVTQIFMYQMQQEHGDKVRWKIVSKTLGTML